MSIAGDSKLASIQTRQIGPVLLILAVMVLKIRTRNYGPLGVSTILSMTIAMRPPIRQLLSSDIRGWARHCARRIAKFFIPCANGVVAAPIYGDAVSADICDAFRAMSSTPGSTSGWLVGMLMHWGSMCRLILPLNSMNTAVLV